MGKNKQRAAAPAADHESDGQSPLPPPPPAPPARGPSRWPQYAVGQKVRLLLRPGAKPVNAELQEGGDPRGAAIVIARMTTEEARAQGLSHGRLQDGRISFCGVAGPATDSDVFPRFEV